MASLEKAPGLQPENRIATLVEVVLVLDEFIVVLAFAVDVAELVEKAGEGLGGLLGFGRPTHGVLDAGLTSEDGGPSFSISGGS